MLRRARWVLLVLAVGLVVGLCGWLQAWLDWGNGPTRGGPPGEIWAYAPHEAAHAAGVVIDVAEVNRAAIERIRASQGGLLVVVPGFTAVTTATPVQIGRAHV